MTTLITVLSIAFLTSLALTPVIRRVARAVGLVDKPDMRRKMHAAAVPLGGGVAVLVAVLVAVGAAHLPPSNVSTKMLENSGQLGWLLAAAFITCVVGLYDDYRGLRGRQKLAGQLLAVATVMASGLLINRVRVFGWELELGLLTIPFTAFWLLGAMNALNLLDGADGLATTIGIVVSATLAAMSVLGGHPVDAVVAAAIAGALIGFLVYNFPPASIFLGDTGSMLIGLAVGVLAIRSSLKGPATVALAAPMAILAIPIFDSAAAILRRRLTGRSIYTTDRGHLHHCLLRCGLSAKGMLFWIAVLCGVTSVGALISVYMMNELFALMSAAVVGATLMATRIFGFAELMLLTSRLVAFGGSLVATQGQAGMVRQHSIRLQGSRNWDEFWDALTDFGERHSLNKIRLDLNVPWLHEGYNGTWERTSAARSGELWSTIVPVAARGRTLGKLEIVGPVNRDCFQLLGLIAELLESLQPCMDRLSAEIPRDALDTEETSMPPGLPAQSKYSARKTPHTATIGTEV